MEILSGCNIRDIQKFSNISKVKVVFVELGRKHNPPKEIRPRGPVKRCMRWFNQGHQSVNGRCFDIGIPSARN